MKNFVLLSLLLQTGCWSAAQQQSMIDRSVRELTGCPQATGTIVSTGGLAMGYSAQGCGREWICKPPSSYQQTSQGCEETPESAKRTAIRVVIDRLALETACDPASIRVAAASEWKVGTEQAFRLEACGKPYLCTLASGRSECKPAL